MRFIHPVAWLTACLTAWLGMAAFAADDPGGEYEKRLSIQLQAMALKDEQRDDFMKIYSDYQDRANGAVRRVTLYGGDFEIRVRRELGRIGRGSVKKMSKVLTPQQIGHYEALIEIANERYLESVGLSESY